MVAIGRPREFDRMAALGDAMALFWRKGFASTSMTDLCEAMGIRSPSLYAAFGSKEALYLEAIAHYVATVGPMVWGELAKGETARDAVANLLAAAATMLPGTDGMPAGCMMMLAAIGDEWPAPISQAAGSIRRESFQNLRSRLKSAVEDGELPPSVDIDRLSRFYLAIIQGMAIQAKDGASAADLLGVAEEAMAVWPMASDDRRMIDA